MNYWFTPHPQLRIEGKRPLRKPRYGWKNATETYVKKMGY
jgi:hypothetical protein